MGAFEAPWGPQGKMTKQLVRILGQRDFVWFSNHES